MAEFSTYIGLDVHKEKVSVAVADPGGGQPRYWGEIENRPEAMKRRPQPSLSFDHPQNRYVVA